MQKSNLSLFHFFYCQLIEECYTNYKQEGYITRLKKIGCDTGLRLFPTIALKKNINERPTTISGLVKNIQTKVFKYLFNYQCSNSYTASKDLSEVQKQYYHVIVDNISVYLTWMPEHLWENAIFVGGIIEGILTASGLKCEVTCSSKTDNSDKIQTQFFVRISQHQYQKWQQSQ